MKNLFWALFVLAVMAIPVYAQDEATKSVQLDLDYWNSLSPDAKKAFVQGFVLGASLDKYNTFLKYDLETGAVPIAGKEDDFIASLDKISATSRGSIKLIYPFGALFPNIAEQIGGAVAENSKEEDERVPWLSLKLDPDKYAKDVAPKIISIDSIRLFDDFRETVVRLDDPDLTPVIFFEAKIDNDILFTDNAVGWNFVVCMERDFGQRAIERMGTISPDKRVEGFELRNAKCQVYKIAYQKIWLIVIRDAD